MIKLGDIFVSTWGYDQTNVDYYQVTKVISDKTVEVTPIESQRTDDSHVQPNLHKFCGESLKRRIKKWYDGTPAINDKYSYSAKLWDGEPRYETPFGCGH